MPNVPPPSATSQTLPTSWTARWIEPTDTLPQPEVQRPVYRLATDFTVDDLPRRALLHVTAHGVFEAFINGERVGDHELSPGFTSYRHRLQVQTFDVTHMLQPGRNAIGALVSDGWWRGQHGIARQVDSYGATVGLLAELHADVAGGSAGDATRLLARTDAGWRWAPSHILAADLVAGEVHDLRAADDSWSTAGARGDEWSAVRLADHPFEVLCLPIGPPSRRVQELRARTVNATPAGGFVIDFGQNIHGWVRLTDTGPRGTRLTLAYGEALAADGSVTQHNIALSPYQPRRETQPPFQQDVVISNGDDSVFEPRHSSKGFRFVQIDGHPGPLSAGSITAVVVHSDIVRIGGFSCDDDRINRLHDAAEWSFRGNICEIPTDCPTRERSGWTGDWQLFIATAAFMYDVIDLSDNWMRDVAAEQLPSGAVLNIVPDPHDFDGGGRDWWRPLQGSAGWGDAACHVPWEMYRASGRTDFIAALLPTMARWVDFATERAATLRHPSRVAARPEPAAHERYLWDGGFHFGEWLEPGIQIDAEIARIATLDHGPTATAYLYRSASELSTMAGLVGDTATHERYAALAEQVLDAWRTEFIDDDGHIRPQTQATLVRALAFGLVPSDLRAVATDDLVRLIREAGTHVGTGFLATPFLLPVLADNGALDVAYELLLQDTEPSWLTMIDRGATTVWEQWDGVRADGSVAASLNHYSKGAVVSFLHNYVAGLQLVEPGYRRFQVRPRPGGGITRAAAFHESPFGRIEVAWQIVDSIGTLDLEVPAETEAVVALPDGSTMDAAPGTHRWSWQHHS